MSPRIAVGVAALVLALAIIFATCSSEPSYEIVPEPAPTYVAPREPRVRSGDRPMTYNPMDDM